MQGNGYQVVVFMRTTPEMTWPTNQYDQYGGPYIAGVANQPGPWQTEWNGHLGNGQGALVEEPCTYTFDIGVWEAANPYDWSGNQTVDDNQWMKYNYWLWIPEMYVAADGSTKPGHDLSKVHDDASDSMKARISYYLADASGVDPSSAAVYLLDGDFALKTVYTNGAAQCETPYEDVDIYTLSVNEEGAALRAVFTGIDNHPESRRDHLNRRMVAVNRSTGIIPILVDRNTHKTLGLRWTQDQANLVYDTLAKLPGNPVKSPRGSVVTWYYGPERQTAIVTDPDATSVRDAVGGSNRRGMRPIVVVLGHGEPPSYDPEKNRYKNKCVGKVLYTGIKRGLWYNIQSESPPQEWLSDMVNKAGLDSLQPANAQYCRFLMGLGCGLLNGLNPNEEGQGQSLLTTTARDRGVKTVVMVGYKILNHARADLFLKKFWQYIKMGKSIKEAADAAYAAQKGMGVPGEGGYWAGQGSVTDNLQPPGWGGQVR